ncbi:Vacuolar protein sorting-associated protein 62 [Cinnamomum micranthum f. kanehirae]|uniref:Vacuolar protein sorting-associated protein 62 n=1 Tax=Cinnamomum micranthum f. kanehirae TaxID=337451 RepID=A0A443NGP0_9MAGN|nr:Vacuolar protein sorting-associated protein 62 [Cinnamomum micranthum f. kanehirae]
MRVHTIIPIFFNFIAALIPPKRHKLLSMESSFFKLPSPIPTWPSGGGFAKGIIDLGGLEVQQISTFTKVWTTYEGGRNNGGAIFFKPTQLPNEFYMLGCFCQPNNKPLFGWVLAGKDADGGALAKPVDYLLVWSSEAVNINQDGYGYIWLPIAPQGYVAVGHTITNSPVKPSPDEMRCVRSDLTEPCELDNWIWGTGDLTNSSSNSSGFNIYGSRPINRGTQAMGGVCVGSFIVQKGGIAAPPFIACLKNKDSNLSAMPSLDQIKALMEAYAPWVYFHPDEPYLPSSVSWFFTNGALLYKQSDANPISIDPIGSNLPQGGSDDGAFWLDLPVDGANRDRVKRGDLQSSGPYLHVKPMLGATFTDIVIWVFYPFNGPARAKIEFVTLDLGQIGEHVGDWEHVTLRISNFNGELCKVYFSEHSSGTWVDASQLEYQGGNKPVTYASLHGHAFYSEAGLHLQGDTKLGIGLRNDTAKSQNSMDTGLNWQLVAAEYLGPIIVEPPWLNYMRKWGPKVTYDIEKEIKKLERFLPGKLKKLLEKLLKDLPSELLGEEGPTGPKAKASWNGDEIGNGESSAISYEFDIDDEIRA